ncbi:GTP cyclohydrolase II, RibA [Kalmanozyma brasiliensis GHG001]|uniref:GTP cyclohydrolase II n=1 Tax=Kalmanozyma brasiliensis (strain GHG001) TaxID=1365824 RepID=V5ETS8_KALBG|nr:GTP cyclohydrolase II, RibA [Kalmanozyma brasiliensis GHG001]EST08690.1 GTP cyclohydrolase II, RibA [Kalmanozyma brasiliensis GHG001]
MMQAANSHSAVTQGDLELLDALTSMSTSFPHQPSYASSSASSSSKLRPLSTLNALRRPPIDPMVLAASLSSGPHVTRHHFHHSFGSHAHTSNSQQMPASQRKAAAAAASAADAKGSTSAGTSSRAQQPRSRRPSAASGSYANCDFDDFDDVIPSRNAASSSAIEIEPVPEVTDEERAYYASRQAPRSVRLQQQKDLEQKRAQAQAGATRQASSPDVTAKSQTQPQASTIRASDEPLQPSLLNQPGNQASKTVLVPPSLPADKIAAALDERKAALTAVSAPTHIPLTPAAETLSYMPPQVGTPAGRASISSIVRPPPVRVRCYARTRVPTPHGEVFCHLYKNTHDTKEHLALVIDPYQNDEGSTTMGPDGRPVKESDAVYQEQALRSKSLDEVWGPSETDMERIVRGAYVGRLGPSFQVASRPLARHGQAGGKSADDEIAPLVRIHSECFTGETIGSQRCDCGEQLDEAIRLISEAYVSRPSAQPQKLGRGVIVYLRQEGRGIGLLDKLMAYNLQDMGHDTVSANILLGHLPDARKYDIASAILRDLGVDECRLLTNNPEKMEALEAEGVRVVERVGMVPRVWKFGKRLRRKKGKKRTTASRPVKMGARASLLRQISANGLEGSVISQAGTESDDDPTSAGLRHQGEDMLQPHDRPESDDEDSGDDSDDSYIDHVLRRSGTTMIGASITKGPELEKYLRTKVERMGHLLTVPTEEGGEEGKEGEAETPVSQPNTDDEGEAAAV